MLFEKKQFIRHYKKYKKCG